MKKINISVHHECVFTHDPLSYSEGDVNECPDIALGKINQSRLFQVIRECCTFPVVGVLDTLLNNLVDGKCIRNEDVDANLGRNSTSLKAGELKYNGVDERLKVKDGEGLEEAVRDLLPHGGHRMCVKHIYANFKKKWTRLHYKTLFWGATTSTLEFMDSYYADSTDLNTIGPSAAPSAVDHNFTGLLQSVEQKINRVAKMTEAEKIAKESRQKDVESDLCLWLVFVLDRHAHTFFDLENLNNLFSKFFNFNTWPLQERRVISELRKLINICLIFHDFFEYVGQV
nr:hypothetical protein CTI12_AA159120 [Tanacetum cinerariifolium]